MAEKAKIVEDALEGYLSLSGAPERLREAMRYSVFSGGKRFRPILVIATAESIGSKAKDVLPTACGIELIHTYSLIHDDLPAMDDDDVRRGKLTCHKAFDEATAILAGDALLTLGLELVARQAEVGTPPGIVLEVLKMVAEAAGAAGMVGGQMMDIEYMDKQRVNPAILDYIHAHKTGALIRCCVASACILCEADTETTQNLIRYGEALGLAFQVVDDILDAESGKRENASYPAVYGIEESKNVARALRDIAHDNISFLGENGWVLRELADFVVSRKI